MQIWLIFGIKKNIFIRYFKLYLFIYCFCIMYHECHIWFLRHFEDFFEIAISCICQINIIFLSFYINSLLYFMLFRYHLVVFSYLVFNMYKHSIFFQVRIQTCSVFCFICGSSYLLFFILNYYDQIYAYVYVWKCYLGSLKMSSCAEIIDSSVLISNAFSR